MISPPAPESPSIRRALLRLAEAPLARTTVAELAGRFLDGLGEILDTEHTALLLLEESTYEFVRAGVRPASDAARVDALVADLIDVGAFAEALREGHPRIARADGTPEGRVLLVPVATGAVTAGMGLAAVRSEPDRLEDVEALAVLLASRLEGRGASDRAAEEIAEQRRIREEKDALNLDLERSIFRLRRLEQQRDDLTRMIVHDLRTPMTSVKTTLDLLARGLLGNLTPRELDLAQVAAKSSDRLLGMINDLLDISKFEAGEMTASPQATDLATLLGGVAESLRPLARVERKTLVYDGPADTDDVDTDADLLRRIVENLAGNALRFSPPGSTVTIGLRLDDGSCEVAVSDEGEGIPPEYQERIFEKFVQVESRRLGRRLGTGLGLTFCQYATRALGGEIRVVSEPGRGSTFTVRIPAPATATSAAPASPDRADRPSDAACLRTSRMSP